eukprot:5112797-Pyramimonas_sp.AAC.1
MAITCKGNSVLCTSSLLSQPLSISHLRAGGNIIDERADEQMSSACYDSCGSHLSTYVTPMLHICYTYVTPMLRGSHLSTLRESNPMLQ